MKCYRKNGSDCVVAMLGRARAQPSMKCYRKNGSDPLAITSTGSVQLPSMKCYRKNGSDDADTHQTRMNSTPQ